MTTQEWIDYIEKSYGVIADRPWQKYPENRVCRHKKNKKWFALFMPVLREKLGIQETVEEEAQWGRNEKISKIIHVVNVKLEPEMITVLRNTKGFFPAYHMNKALWVTVTLDGSVDDEEIKNLIDISFSLTEK